MTTYRIVQTEENWFRIERLDGQLYTYVVGLTTLHAAEEELDKMIAAQSFKPIVHKVVEA